MRDAGPGVLVTRPEPGASSTAARLAVLGFRPVMAPLLHIHTVRPRLPPPERVRAILVTSGNAIPALPASHHALPLFAVGSSTAERARAAGFALVQSADGDAHALAALVARNVDRRAGPLLFLSGRGQGSGLAQELRTIGYGVIRRVAYAAVPVRTLPDEARRMIASGQVIAAPFFSAETARHCVRLLRAARLHEAVRSIDALAISQPVAVALEPLPWRRIRVADRPNQDAMLTLLG